MYMQYKIMARDCVSLLTSHYDSPSKANGVWLISWVAKCASSSVESFHMHEPIYGDGRGGMLLFAESNDDVGLAQTCDSVNACKKGCAIVSMAYRLI